MKRSVSILKNNEFGRCERPKKVQGKLTALIVPFWAPPSDGPKQKVQILLTQSAKGGNWIFPQEGYEPRDGALDGTIRRGLFEELGVGSDAILYPDREFGRYFNPERDKSYHVYPVRLKETRGITVNPHEVTGYRWVSTYAEFRNLVYLEAKQHVLKVRVMEELLTMLLERLGISWAENTEPEAVT